jgi:hypothetical protein
MMGDAGVNDRPPLATTRWHACRRGLPEVRDFRCCSIFPPVGAKRGTLGMVPGHGRERSGRIELLYDLADMGTPVMGAKAKVKAGRPSPKNRPARPDRDKVMVT